MSSGGLLVSNARAGIAASHQKLCKASSATGDPGPDDLIPPTIRALKTRVDAVLKANGFTDVTSTVVIDMQYYPAVGLHGEISSTRRMELDGLVKGCITVDDDPDDLTFYFIDNTGGTTRIVYFSL